MAFHLIELHPDTRDVTTFAAPDGLYRYKRLFYGVNMATEKFQQLIWQVLQDSPRFPLVGPNEHWQVLEVGN